MFEKIIFEENEQVLCTVRKHWFFIVAGAVALTGIYTLPFIATITALSLTPLGETAEQLTPYGVEPILLFFIGLWTLAVWIAFFNIWTNYYLDTWTITNRRVMVVNQRGLFHRTVASFRLERLQEINIETDGMFATLLGFGTIHALTAGHDDEFIMRGAPRPEQLKALILEKVESLSAATANAAR